MRVSRRLLCCFDKARSFSSDAIRALGEEGEGVVGRGRRGNSVVWGSVLIKGFMVFFQVVFGWFLAR